MDFVKGDIVEYCGEYYEVERNHGNSGVVWELNGKLKRTGLRIEPFYREVFGETCKLVKRV